MFSSFQADLRFYWWNNMHMDHFYSTFMRSDLHIWKVRLTAEVVDQLYHRRSRSDFRQPSARKKNASNTGSNLFAAKVNSYSILHYHPKYFFFFFFNLYQWTKIGQLTRKQMIIQVPWYNEKRLNVVKTKYFLYYEQLRQNNFLSSQCFVYVIYSIANSMFTGECPRAVIVKSMNCGVVITGFELQLRYFVHFWANTLTKDMNPFILSAMD